jgi:hypothetical protein
MRIVARRTLHSTGWSAYVQRDPGLGGMKCDRCCAAFMAVALAAVPEKWACG